MDPEQYDWSTFDLVFYYRQPIDIVFQAWATSAGLETFFIETAVYRGALGDPRPPDEAATAGDRYEWQWRHDASLDGRVTGVEAGRAIAFTFGDMQVAITLSEIDQRTELHLRQTNIPDTDRGRVLGHLNCRSCWIFFLTNLRSVLEAGLDLRDSRPDLVSSMEVGFEALSRH